MNEKTQQQWLDGKKGGMGGDVRGKKVKAGNAGSKEIIGSCARKIGRAKQKVDWKN